MTIDEKFFSTQQLGNPPNYDHAITIIINTLNAHTKLLNAILAKETKMAADLDTVVSDEHSLGSILTTLVAAVTSLIALVNALKGTQADPAKLAALDADIQTNMANASAAVAAANAILTPAP